MRAAGRGSTPPPEGARTPLRSCLGCRRKRPQRELLRLRVEAGQAVVDEGRRRGPGRGAYLCADLGCWAAARKRGALARALGPGLGADQASLGAALEGIIGRSAAAAPGGAAPANREESS